MEEQQEQQQQEEDHSFEEISPVRGSLLSLAFNQDSSCVACGTENGFRIYNCDPLAKRYSRNLGKRIRKVEMLHTSNILALVGDGSDPKFASSNVVIWDDQKSRSPGQLEFRSEVKGVRLQCERIVVILKHKVFIYSLSNLSFVDQIEVGISNHEGLCAVAEDIVACPGHTKGKVVLLNLRTRNRLFVEAHTSSLSCIALSLDGELLATASTKGTVIRVFSTQTCKLLHEFRRGSDRATIFSMAFSACADWLALSSDKNTVHVFGLKGGKGKGWGLLKGAIPTYSTAQFRLPQGSARTLVAFSPTDAVLVVSADGSFFQCVFDPVHGETTVQHQTNILEL